jgi:two-component system nitrate/nitrite response regulator NarL
MRASALSKRQREVLECRREGLTCKEIAGRLKLSTRTIEEHLQRVYRRLNARNTIEALRRLDELGNSSG